MTVAEDWAKTSEFMANRAHCPPMIELAQFNLKDGALRVWNGRYKITVAGLEWQPHHGRIQFGNSSTGSDAFLEANEFEVNVGEGSEELSRLIWAEYQDQAHRRFMARFWTVLNDDMQPLTPDRIWYSSSGYMDVPTYDDDVTGQRFVVTVESAFATQQFPPQSYATDYHLRQRYPNAALFEFQKGIMQPDYEPKW